MPEKQHGRGTLEHGGWCRVGASWEGKGMVGAVVKKETGTQ